MTAALPLIHYAPWAERQQMVASSDKSNARVLVVDDEVIVAETLEIIFSGEGYEARAVHSAEAALALLETEQWIPQFAIVDVHLPGRNGIELAIMLKERYPEVRVCLFSGRAETCDLMEEANKQGHSFDVMAKPVYPTVFLAILESRLPEEGGGERAPATPIP